MPDKHELQPNFPASESGAKLNPDLDKELSQEATEGKQPAATIDDLDQELAAEPEQTGEHIPSLDEINQLPESQPELSPTGKIGLLEGWLQGNVEIFPKDKNIATAAQEAQEAVNEAGSN